LKVQPATALAIDRLVMFDVPKEAVPDGAVPVLQLEPVP
jgi:hypothetical protein